MLCFFSVHIAFGQQHPDRFSPVMSFDSPTGFVWANGERSDLIGGFGLSFYWYLHSVGEKRRHYYGLDVISRGLMASENEPESTRRRFMEQGSQAVLFRWDTQLLAGKDRFWMFAGAGPEMRISKLSKGYFFAPMFQQEIGLTWRSRGNSAFLSSMDLGVTCSLPVRTHEWRQGLVFGAIFTRMAMF
jgi:hypothetical protein